MKLLLFCFFGIIITMAGIVIFDGFIEYVCQISLIALMILSGGLGLSSHFD